MNVRKGLETDGEPNDENKEAEFMEDTARTAAVKERNACAKEVKGSSKHSLRDMIEPSDLKKICGNGFQVQRERARRRTNVTPKV